MHWRSESAPAQGFVAPGFEAVAEEFARNFTVRGDVGAAFAATHDGRPVVDLWGGAAAPGKQWAEDTLQVVYSGTKGLLAACILLLVERGQLDLRQPVAAYWPEFAQAGKERVLVRHVTSHSSGLPGVTHRLSAEEYVDYERIETLLAAQPLASDPNAYHCYHPLTLGWLVGALVRRVDGRSVGQFFAEEIARPLGMEAWIGLPVQLEPRVGRIELGPGMVPFDEAFPAAQRRDPVFVSAWGNPPLFPEDLPWNTRSYHAAEIAGAGGIATARSMARYYGCMSLGGTIGGIQVLKPESVALGRAEQSRFTDPYIAEDMAFGVCWALQTPQRRFGPAPDGFGHAGAGGSIHGAWPTQKVGFSYVMNQMRADPNPDDPRTRYVLRRLHEIVA